MRSVLKNKVDEFLKILEHDKTNWYEFWKGYKKRLFPILDNYEKTLSLEDSGVENIISSFERRNLDRFRRYWEERKRELKQRVAYELRKRAKEFELSREDFTVFLVGALGLRESVVVEGKREKVILIDVLKIWNDGNIERLHEVVLEAVGDFRRGDEGGRVRGQAGNELQQMGPEG